MKERPSTAAFSDFYIGLVFPLRGMQRFRVMTRRSAAGYQSLHLTLALLLTYFTGTHRSMAACKTSLNAAHRESAVTFVD